MHEMSCLDYMAKPGHHVDRKPGGYIKAPAFEPSQAWRIWGLAPYATLRLISSHRVESVTMKAASIGEWVKKMSCYIVDCCELYRSVKVWKTLFRGHTTIHSVGW